MKSNRFNTPTTKSAVSLEAVDLVDLFIDGTQS